MGSQHSERALARLNQIADLGYTAFSTFSGDTTSVLASTYKPAWTREDIQKLRDSRDPLIVWFDGNLDISTAEAALATKTSLSDLPLETTTLASDLVGGARIGLVMSHSSGSLDPEQVNEARAAAHILHVELSNVPESGITAKELVYLEQVSAGATDDEIADDLQLSLRAVKERKRKAIDDLNAQNIGHAVGIAKRTGLI